MEGPLLRLLISSRSVTQTWPPQTVLCLVTDQIGMSNSHRGRSIDASYHVSVHLAKRFQRRRFLEINQSETRIVCDGHVF
jgi:hypothetical protein